MMKNTDEEIEMKNIYKTLAGAALSAYLTVAGAAYAGETDREMLMVSKNCLVTYENGKNRKNIFAYECPDGRSMYSKNGRTVDRACTSIDNCFDLTAKGKNSDEDFAMLGLKKTHNDMINPGGVVYNELVIEETMQSIERLNGMYSPAREEIDFDKIGRHLK